MDQLADILIFKEEMHTKVTGSLISCYSCCAQRANGCSTSLLPLDDAISHESIESPDKESTIVAAKILMSQQYNYIFHQQNIV